MSDLTKSRALAHIIAYLSAVLGPGQVFEVRAPEVPDGKSGWLSTWAGIFDDVAKAAAEAWSLTQMGALAVYFTLNPCKPELIYRRDANRVVKLTKKGEQVSDSLIISRRWLPLDFDAKRPVAGISATDAEHQDALDRAAQCRDYLASIGWPAPIEADSGNGAHLLYRVDLPNTPDSLHLVERVLAGLQDRFGDERVTVDQTVGNAARIWKLPATMVRKGGHSAERPHRWARCLAIPEVTL